MIAPNELQFRRTAVVLAAGSGTRLGAETNKAWIKIAGREMAAWSVIRLQQTNLFEKFIVVVHPVETDIASEIFLRNRIGNVEIISGGNSRHASELKAIEHLENDITERNCHYVLIHDAARPLISSDLIAALVDAADDHSGAIPVLATNKLVGYQISADETIFKAQTPQIFKASVLLDSYKASAKEGFEGTDTASCVGKYFPDLEIKAVIGSAQNIKVTYSQDLIVAEHILSQSVSTNG